MQGHYIEFTGGRGEYSTIPFRYVWAGEPFTSVSATHVLVWQKPGS